MIDILQNVHTYLLISFITTIIILFKYFYKKLDNSLEKDVNSIRETLAELENKKIEASNQVELLKQELLETENNISKAVAEAEQKAKEIIETSNKNIAKILEQKQKEYDIALEKIETSFSIELKNKFVTLILQALEEKIKEGQTSREFQNSLIENSIKRLEQLIENYKG